MFSTGFANNAVAVPVLTILLLFACQSQIESDVSSVESDVLEVQDPAPVLNIPPIPAFIRDVQKNGKKLLVHYKTSFEHDDNPGCVAFNVVLGGLAAGYEVEMLYDAGGVYDLKVESDGRPHSYGYAVPDKLKAILASLYPITPAELPATYRDYLYWLATMGADITYNGLMANLVDLQKTPLKRSDQIERIARPVSVSEILASSAAADLYLVY